MLIVTNLDAVNAVYSAKAPRPIRDMILEIYPEATIDCNGRAHAPYDGYECSITGNQYRAGEYLPFSEPNENAMIGGPAPKFPEAMDLDGNLHEWSNCSFAQRSAVYAELIAQSKAYDASRSIHLGEVGSKIKFTATIQVVKGYPGMYGTTWFHVMKDEAGNVIFYKGSKRLADKGKKINVVAKVKAHDVRDEVKQTLVERPKVEA